MFTKSFFPFLGWNAQRKARRRKQQSSVVKTAGERCTSRANPAKGWPTSPFAGFITCWALQGPLVKEPSVC